MSKYVTDQLAELEDQIATLTTRLDELRKSLHTPLTFAPEGECESEAKQREVGADPLDEDNWSDRFDCDGMRLIRVGSHHWHPSSGALCLLGCATLSLADWDCSYGPLTFAPDPLDEDNHQALRVRDGGSEPLWCPECGHHIDYHHNGDCITLCECMALPSQIAQALIAEAVTKVGRRG